MKQVSVKARVFEIPKPKMVYTKWGTAAYISNALIADETGTIRISLWNNRSSVGEQMVAVGGIVVKGDQFLLVKRKAEPRKGFWCIPGGIVEPGETIRDAIEREILEETGIETEVIGAIDLCEFPPYGKDVYITFLTKYLCGSAKPDSDAEDAKWFSQEEIERLEKMTTLPKLLIRKVVRNDYTVLKVHTIEEAIEEFIHNDRNRMK